MAENRGTMGGFAAVNKPEGIIEKAQKTKKKIALLAVMCCEQKKIARSSALI